MTPLFETERLLIRAWTPSDAADVFAIYGDPDVMRYLGGDARPDADLAASRRRLERWAERFAAISPFGLWAMQRRVEGDAIGSVGIVPLPEATGDLELVYHLRRSAWGAGYATEVARGALEYARRRLGVTKLCALVFPENVASRRVLEKCGFTSRGLADYAGQRLELLVR